MGHIPFAQGTSPFTGQGVVGIAIIFVRVVAHKVVHESIIPAGAEKNGLCAERNDVPNAARMGHYLTDWRVTVRYRELLDDPPRQRRTVPFYAFTTFFFPRGSMGMVSKMWSHSGELTPKAPWSPT